MTYQRDPSPNNRTDRTTDTGLSQSDMLLLPQESAADVGRGNYARVQFDSYIGEMLEHHARCRTPSSDPSDKAYRDHLIGIASEVAVATWKRGDVNTHIYPDYEGDNGVDVVAPAKWHGGVQRIQVKATRDITTPERIVKPDELQAAELIVLCRTNAPAQYVEIVGYIQTPLLNVVGQAYGKDGYILAPEHLYPVKPMHYTPDDVRSVIHTNSVDTNCD